MKGPRFDRPEFDLVFGYPARMCRATGPHPERALGNSSAAIVRLSLDPHNGLTISRHELDEVPGNRDSRTARPAIDRLMADLVGQPVRGSSLTLGGLPALEYDFSYFASAVPSLRSHAFVLIDGATGYIVNCESTDAHREEMDRAIEVVLRSPRPR